MAFSFRAGTNWCHDFPKLARESGFYFNMHAARVRVDWNRIGSIDIDRVIRERDFQIVDENVNNVIDYYLESEYDVKILDPNFVKLFRLAQLAVEYLLYCKQYLDQSVVILKEELKYKIEENVKLKKESTQLQDNVKEIKEKFKERNKSAESCGEIHKCPWCPKTFISASFANAHLIRRHSNLTEVISISPPVHEEYRTETEKLHNEIKTLKERLNQTERVIRNESNKIISQNEITNKEKKTDSFENSEDQYRRYQEEMSDLKTMLFTEIKNIKKKENSSNQYDNETNHENIKDLVNRQENEIQRLKIQLQEHLTLNTNEVEIKLLKQEEYWKSKIEHLENQRRNDIDNLFSQLKLTQESSVHMKSDYEDKISFLEKQSIDQSKLLTAQSEQLKLLMKSIENSQTKKSLENDVEMKKLNKQKIETLTEDIVDSESSQNFVKPSNNKVIQGTKQSIINLKCNENHYKLLKNKKTNESLKLKSREEFIKEYNFLKHKEKKTEKGTFHKKTTKAGKKYSSLNESEESESSINLESEIEFEEDIEEETSDTFSKATYTDSTNEETYSKKENKVIQPNNHLKKYSSQSMEIIKKELREVFDHRLRDLGIDPEWITIPVATFKEKLESIVHHQNILSKKFPKYEQIRKKLLEEVSRRIPLNKKSPKKFELEKKSFLNKAMKNVKSKALKALHEFKVQKNNDTSISVLSSKNSTPRESRSKRKLNFELLPKKPTQLDIQEIKNQAKLESSKKQRKDEPPPRSKSNFHNEDKIQQPVLESTMEPIKQTKQLQRSYQSIEEFMRDIEEIPKLDTSTTKMVSTSTVKNILQDSYIIANDSQSMKHDTTWALGSPKNNKSVLKSTSGTVGLVKKKVLFDLETESSPDRRFIGTKFIEGIIKEECDENKELSNSSWNIPSIQEENERITVKEKNASIENIQLKTSQSEKIAEISRKIQEKLETSRRKPVGSIEAMFSSKTFSIDNDKTENVNNNQNSIDMVNFKVDNSTSQIETKARSNSSQVPRPAPRRQLFETKDSVLNMRIDELLASN